MTCRNTPDACFSRVPCSACSRNMYNKWPRIPWTYPTEDEMNHEHDIEQWRWATGGGLERRYWREGWK